MGIDVRITKADAIALLRRAVKEKGADYIDPSAYHGC